MCEYLNNFTIFSAGVGAISISGRRKKSKKRQPGASVSSDIKMLKENKKALKILRFCQQWKEIMDA